MLEGEAHLQAVLVAEEVGGVADLPLGAIAEDVAGGVRSGLERVAHGEPLLRSVRVGRLLVFAATNLEVKFVQVVGARGKGVPEGEVPVVAVELVPPRLVGNTADVEVILTVAFVGELGCQLLTIGHRVIDAAERHRLIPRVRHVRRLGGECAARTEVQRDVIGLHVLGRQEEVGLVLLDRSAERETVLPAVVVTAPRITATRQIQRSLGSQAVGAIVAEDRPHEVVGSGARHDRERAAGGAADLRVEAVVDDPELADCVLRELYPRKAQGRVGEVDAVHHDRGLRGVAPGADHRVAADETVGAALALDARDDECQLLEVTVRHRQRLDLFRDDVGRGVGLHHVDERRLRGHGDHFRLGLGELHRSVDPQRLSDPKLEVLLGNRDKPFELDADRVRSRRQCGKARDARGIGWLRPHQAGGGVRELGCHAGQRQLAAVRDLQLDRRVVNLRKGRTRDQQSDHAGREGEGTKPPPRA